MESNSRHVRIKKIIYTCPCAVKVEIDMSSQQQGGDTLDFPNKICLNCGRIMEVKTIKE